MVKKISSVLLIMILIVFSNCLVYAAVTQVDLTGLATGADVNHQHVYVDSFDGTYHFKRCFICGGVINKAAHSLNLIGNGPTCDVYVVLGRYVCSGCGYEKPVERLAHIWPANPVWSDYLGYAHLSWDCQRCHGGGSNNQGGNHRFNYKGGTYTIFDIRDTLHEDPHSLSALTCIDCHLTISWPNHNCYSNTCNICGKRLAGTTSYNNTSIDLVNNVTDYVYVTVISDIPGNAPSADMPSVSSLYGGNYVVGTPTLYSQSGQNYVYKVPISLRDRSIPISESMCLYFRKYFNSYAVEDNRTIKLEVTPPSISTVQCIPQVNVSGWTTINNIVVTGTENLCAVVYVSMYGPGNREIFKNQAVEVSNRSFNFTITPELEANQPTTFTVYVRDLMGNESSKNVVIQKTDNRAPTLYNDSGSISSELNYLSPWRQNQLVTFKVKDEGVGQVQIGFNNTNDYQAATYNSSTGYYERQYNFYGNVPTQVTGALYVKDGLGNEKMYKINFNKLDNTKPTITASNKTYGDSVTATIGDTYAGVAGHQITSSNSQPSTWIADSSESSKNVSFGIKNVGTWYLWVKDGAGNVNSTSMSVSKRSITITANNQTTYYPTRITKTAAYATSSYLPSGQSISAITLTDNPGGTSFPTPNANGIGTGTITPSAVTITSTTDGNVTSNYTITYANGTWTVKDNTKPTGRIKITNPVILRDGRQAVGSTATNVTITAADDYAKVKEIYLFNENNITTPVGNIPASSWINWDSSTSLTNIGTNTKTMNWTLSNGDGAKTVYLYIRDRAGNVTITF